MDLNLLKATNRTAFLHIIFLLLLFFGFHSTADAKKKYPVIKFEQTTINLGTFTHDEAVQKCTFKFRNVGDAPLVLNYVHTSCGCTIANYPKEPLPPGASGTISVTYDGSKKMPGPFRKSIQVYSNCKEDYNRLFIEGKMTELVRENKK